MEITSTPEAHDALPSPLAAPPVGGNGVLATYATSGIRVGGVAPQSTGVSALGFSAMLLTERDLEIAVPALDFNVFVMMLGDRRPVDANLAGRKGNVVYRSGDQLIIPAGADTWFRSQPGEYPVLHLHFDGAAIRCIFGEDAPTLRPVLQAADPLVKEAGLRLRAALQAGSCEANALYLQSLFVVIARQLTSLVPAASITSGGLAPWQFKRATDYLLAHLAEDVTLNEVAAVVGLSPSHFCRAFARSAGAPAHTWLTQKRVERAQELMVAHAEMGLAEVALAVGYGSQAAFTVAFRRVTGATPSQWRRERRF